MAKKSHKKRPKLSKKDNVGCMSGLISMFDFRQGRFTHRLLSDKKWEGNSRRGGTVYSRNKVDLNKDLEEDHEYDEDTDLKGIRRVNSVRANSIKALIAEEMSGAITSKQISSSGVERLRAEPGFGANLEKNYTTTNNVNSESSQSIWSSPSDIDSFDANLAELVVEFFSGSDKCQEKYDILQKALGTVTDTSLTEKCSDSKQILEMLKANKEIILKHLEDPDSPIFKHVLDLQKSQTSKFAHGNELEVEPAKKNKYYFFKKKDKSNKSTSQDINRIVVLKPSPSKYHECLNTSSPTSSPKPFPTERATSRFSLKEIKRRLINVIGESKNGLHLITMDGILHKVPYGSQNLDEGIRTCRSTEQSSRLPSFLSKRMNKPIESLTFNRESFFYDEARKRLAETLSSRCQNEIWSPKTVSKQLGRMLSAPEHNSLSPRLSPVRDREVDSLRPMMISSPQKIKQEDLTTIRNSLRDSNQDNEVQVMNKNPTVSETQLQMEDSTRNGSTETELVELSTNKAGCISDRCSEKEPATISGSFEEAQEVTSSVAISTNRLYVQIYQSSEITTKNHDCPRPVSILEPFFSGDINCPEQMETKHVDSTAGPQQLRFKELGNSPNQRKLDYVRTVLRASGLNDNHFLERWRLQLSDQLLDPNIYNETEASNDQPIPDSEFLFDCTNEVLNEIRNQYVSFTQWIHSIRPSIRLIPKGENLIQEVCTGIDRCLQAQTSDKADDIIRKDLDRGSWMNVRLETEGAVFDIAEEVLGYIMEETILELWE